MTIRKTGNTVSLTLRLDKEVLEEIKGIMKEVAGFDIEPSNRDFARFMVGLTTQLIYDAKDGFTEIHTRKDGRKNGKVEERHHSIPDRIKIACLEEDK